MMFVYNTRGTCSRQIVLDMEGEIIKDVRFIGGCSGNLQGISHLITGQNLNDVIPKIKGIQCRNNTSCPDQLANALEAYKQQNIK